MELYHFWTGTYGTEYYVMSNTWEDAKTALYAKCWEGYDLDRHLFPDETFLESFHGKNYKVLTGDPSFVNVYKQG